MSESDLEASGPKERTARAQVPALACQGMVRQQCRQRLFEGAPHRRVLEQRRVVRRSYKYFVHQCTAVALNVISVDFVFVVRLYVAMFLRRVRRSDLFDPVTGHRRLDVVGPIVGHRLLDIVGPTVVRVCRLQRLCRRCHGHRPGR